MKFAVLNRCLAPVAICLTFTPLVASDSVAQQRSREGSERVIQSTAEQKAFGGLVAPNARLAGLFNAGGAPIRTKGVVSIQRIDTGTYCIRPALATNINVNNIVVQATVEYSYSSVNESTVQWAAAQSGCGAGRIGIFTFVDSNRDGFYSFSNTVAFSVSVP